LFQLIRGRVFVKEKIPEIILLAMVATYSIVFSYLTVLKLQALGMHAWDFGIYLQAIHTTVTSGKLFYTTVELPYTITAIPPGTQFAVHFSPILFLIVPFYALFQTPITLLVIKSLAIAIGAIPVFLLAKKALGKPMWGLVFSAGYLLYPAVQGINWYDFQPQIFFTTFALFTILFIELRRNKLALLFSILTMSSVEIAPFFIIALGLTSLAVQRKSLIELLRQRKFSALSTSLPIALILVAIIWLALVFSTLVLFGWQTSFHLSQERRFSIADPFNLPGALSYDWQAKLTYIALILCPFAFLSLLDPIRLLPGGLWIIFAVLSNYPPYYSLGCHYLSFAIPFVVVSSIFGVKRIYKPSNKQRTQIMSLILCCAIGLATIASSPIGPFHLGNNPWTGPFGIPTMTLHDQYVHDLVDLIPVNASVLTSNDLFPLVAQRINAYVFPFSATFPSNTTDSISALDTYKDFNGTLDSYLRKAEYILYDGTVDRAESVIFPTREAAKDFGLYAEADGAILLKRGYVGNPVFFVYYQRIFRSNDLVVINSTIIQDPSSESGYVLYHYSPNSTSDFWYGPACFLARGTYSVGFRLKIAENPPSSPILLAVVEWPCIVNITMKGSASMRYFPDITWRSGNQEVLSYTSLQVTDFTQQMTYQTFSLQFTVEQPGGFEFVGLAVPNATSVYLDYITLNQVSP
jgi:uncharacterized membrane protein